jgi:crotonobetainyl-CoA:carnitine CoA-transferase CaiB-like acyl-CoA transferase
MTAPVEGALAGIVVADFSRVLAAPYATMLFGDLGADVIKVERPGVGDDTRAWGPPFAGDEATYFLSVNRNKRSFTADLADVADRDELTELIRRADVLIENFRPGTMARHGLSYEQVRELNPRLVYCSITGFGTGKGAALPGYDLLVQAVGGLMSVTGPHPGEPVKAGVALVDVLTGLHAAIGVLAALRARETTGRGQLIEVSLLGSLLSSMVNQSAGYTAAGAVPGILGNRHPSIAPYQLFRPRTDHWWWRSATTGSSPLSAAGSASPSWPGTRDSRPTPTGSPTSTPSTRSSRRGWRLAPPTTGSPSCPRSGSPAGRSTTSRTPSSWPPTSG